MRRFAGLRVALVLLLALSAEASSQGVPPPTNPPVLPGAQRNVPRTAQDSARRDSLLTRGARVTWLQADSIMQELLKLSGHVATRFQGDTLDFNSSRRSVRISGTRSAVSRDSAQLVGDTIIYDDSLQKVTVLSRDIVLRDPVRNTADVLAHDTLTYDVSSGRARMLGLSTATTDQRGALWRLEAGVATLVSRDTTLGNTIAAHDGMLTSCDDPSPHYHFRSKQIKWISDKITVARPTVFYVGDIPVFWLPFMVSDMRPGTRSGFLSPRVGFSDIVRNSPSYRRSFENVGYYLAFSDYADARMWMDWRSGARPTDGDPGFFRLSGELRYKWLDRFMSGTIAVGHTRQSDGRRNTAISLSHIQEFSMTRRLSADINYVTSTRVQQRQAISPFSQNATIRSRASYTHALGPLSLNLGAARTQYPGLDLVDQTLPTLNLTSKPLEIAPRIVFTPSLSLNNTERLNVERTGPLSQRYFVMPDGSIDSLPVTGDSRNTSASLSLPMQLGPIRLSNTVRATDVYDALPQVFIVRDVNDTTISSTRVYDHTFRTELDWQSDVSFPATVSARKWNVTPSFSFANIHPGAYWVRSERTGGAFVSQGKRPTFGLSVSPTFYGLFPGLGPFDRFRHTVQMSLGFSFSPAADVSDEYLAAIGRTRLGYLGSLQRRALSLNLSQTFEASLPRADSTSTGPTRSIRLLSVNFTPLTWDFERARATGGQGLSTDRFGVSARSDLLPGLDFSANYSLFEGSVLSDSAEFKPFLTDIRASFSVSKTSNPLSALLGLFGGRSRSEEGGAGVESLTQRDAAMEAQEELQRTMMSSPSVASASSRDLQMSVGDVEEWSLRVDFTASRQRPPSGDVILIEDDAAARCAALNLNPLALEDCIREFQALQLADPNAEQRPPGGAFIRQPARSNAAISLRLPLTTHWAATWNTNYDLELGEFASHIVNLRRDMHDFEANFSFVQSNTGSFSFHFGISLKAQPELKVDYDRSTRRTIGG